MKKWIFLLLLLGGVGFGYEKWRAQKAATETASEANSRPTSATAETRDINFAVNAAGDIGPAEQVSVRPEINGKINSLPVDIGDQVKRGDVLFTLDDQDLQTQRAATLITIAVAKLNVEKTRRNYDRSGRLFTDKLISQELFDDTKTDFDLATNSLRKVEKDLALLDYQLTKTKVEAPFDCTILTRPVSVGQAVSGSGGVAGGTEVLTIANLNEMIINAHINQADVARLKGDQEVEVQIEAVPGLTVKGRVERVAPQATIKNNIKGFATRILLKDVDKRIRPGMTANIKIPVASVANVVAVPLSAVFTEMNPDTMQNERFVFVKTETGYERRPVQIGISDFFVAEIQRGLSPGETVLLEQPKEEAAKASMGFLRDGVPRSGGRSPAASTPPASAPKAASTTNQSPPAVRSGNT